MTILYWYPEALHQRLCVETEALLAWHQCIAVMPVLHISHLRIIGTPDVMVRPENQASSFARKEPSHRLYLLWRSLLPCDVVIQSEDQQRIRVIQYALVERELEAGLVYALEDRNWVTGNFADELLEGGEGPEKELQRPG